MENDSTVISIDRHEFTSNILVIKLPAAATISHNQVISDSTIGNVIQLLCFNSTVK